MVQLSSFSAQHAVGESCTARNNADQEYWHRSFAWITTISAVWAKQGLIAQCFFSLSKIIFREQSSEQLLSLLPVTTSNEVELTGRVNIGNVN